ncbi:hypothetical protein ACFVFH_15285 [Streptomyces sp. NPDC057697]|uniref:hypothetical protein n=1 Tax=Streptomyces sp. NPDC057697 TaxID=3346219 RepID=UPI0036C59AA5
MHTFHESFAQDLLAEETPAVGVTQETSLTSAFDDSIVVAAWRPGGLAAWRPGGLAAWRPGGLAAWRAKPI